MLLITWTDFWWGVAGCFEWSFRVMEGLNRNMNVLLIVIGFIGAIYWLWRQNKYNQEAEQMGSIK